MRYTMRKVIIIVIHHLSIIYPQVKKDKIKLLTVLHRLIHIIHRNNSQSTILNSHFINKMHFSEKIVNKIRILCFVLN